MAEQVPEAECFHVQEAAMHSESPSSCSSRTFKRKFNESEDRIVWPPVVIIENTLTHFDKQEKKWKGLGNEEIRSFLKCFKDIQFGRILPLYGFNGNNRGKSLVVFSATPSGYMDAHTLSELLESDQRGRHHWLQISHNKDPYGPGKVTADGKKILFGYLASGRDMDEADRHRKFVKRWSMERYAEKVLQPLNQCERDKEEARRKRVELTKEAKQKLLAVEHNRVEVDKAAAEFRKMNEEYEAQKKLEEELEAKHKKSFEERKKAYEQEKLQKLESFKERERSIRAHLEQNNLAKQNTVMKFEELARRLKDGIDMEKKNHELRSTQRQQREMLDRIKLDSMLQAEMEEKLAILEKKFLDKQLQLQEQHHQQILKSQQELTVEKEKFLEEKLQELKTIEKESVEAKTATIATQKGIEPYQRDCSICLSDMVSKKLERALFESCNHAKACSECAEKLWKEALERKEKLYCPTCNKVQRKKFSLLTIYR